MAGLGILYGPVLGGFISAAGSIVAGGTAYGLTRMAGRRAALWLVGAEDLARAGAFFDRSGGWAVAVSRSLPLLPEVISCLAGLARMRAGRFFAALICGSLPMGFVFAKLGAAGAHRPMAAMAISAGLPLLLWPVVRRMLAPAPAVPNEAADRCGGSAERGVPAGGSSVDRR
jgi:uncharacterized membrane protein YdjX (TVP38/TMEM64 family)